MLHRERVLNTFDFKKTDRPPCDLMEGILWPEWPELSDYFKKEYGLMSNEEIREFLDLDFRWLFVHMKDMYNTDPDTFRKKYATYSDYTCKRRLADVHSIDELDDLFRNDFDPDNIILPDFKAARERWPEHAIVVLSRVPSLFMTACTDFGMEESLVKMATEPEVFERYIKIQNRYCLDMIPHILRNANGMTDIFWLMDDIASQEDLIMSPDLWRKFFKPHLAKQVKLIKESANRVIFHSCGAIRSVIADLIEIGIDAVLVFQTSARNMDAGSIAGEFGGKMVFYGGIDVQNLLRQGTIQEVKETVKNNRMAFEPYGGYVVANSHHCISDIKGENIVAMCEETHEIY